MKIYILAFIAVWVIKAVSAFPSCTKTSERTYYRLSANRFVPLAATRDDEALTVIGRKYRVVGYEYKPNRYANLKVYEDCGDPYSEVVSYLRHGDIVEATGYRNFAGQTWIQHMVDEKNQGLYTGDFPREPYLGWSPQDLHGYRWLHCLDPPVVAPADEGSIDAREILTES